MADKKEFHYFVLPEYEQEEQYLRDMAKKGYLLEKVALPGFYHFKKAEPTDMIYRIDFNPQKKEDRSGYLQMFKDYGWDYIQDLNEFSYFCKINDGSNDEIISDNQSRIEMMRRIFNRKMLPILVMFFVVILGCLIPTLKIISRGFTVVNFLGLCIVWIVFVTIYISIITKCIAGFSKLRKKYYLK